MEETEKMKLLILLFSFFNLGSIKTDNSINCLYEETEKIVEELNDDYTIEFTDEQLQLYYKEKALVSHQNYCFKYFYFENSVYLFYKEHFNDYFHMEKIANGKIILKKVIQNSTKGEFDVTMNNKCFYIVSTVSEYSDELFIEASKKNGTLSMNNCLLLKVNSDLEIDKIIIYGGQLNDYNYKIYYYNGKLYITGLKETLSGGTFGYSGKNGKGYFLSIFNTNLTIENYAIFDSEIKAVDFLDDIIYVYLSDYLYIIDSQLNVKSSLEIASQCVFGKVIDKFSAITINESEINFYDINTMKLLSSFKFPFNEDFLNYFIINNNLYLKMQYNFLKVVIYEDSIKNQEYIYDNDELRLSNFNVKGLFGIYEARDIDTSDFNPSIFGLYEVIVEYDDFVIPILVRVLERHNVTSGKIYPLNYCLLFSGTGYLNGEEILNNYQIVNEGIYQLKLIGKDEEVIIDFEVQNLDIVFIEDSLKVWDLESFPNEEQEISFDINLNNNFKITNIIINDEDFPFSYDKNRVTIKLKEYEPGIYDYCLNKIVYINENNNKEYFEEINKTWKLKVLNNNLILNNQFEKVDNDYHFISNIENNKQEIRYLKFVLEDNNEEVCYVSLADENVILLFNTNKNTLSLIKCYLVYDLGKQYYEEQLLFSFKYAFSNTNNLGTLSVNSNNNEISMIDLQFNSNSQLKNIIIDNNTVYEYQEINYLIPVITGLAIVGIIYGLYFIIVKRKKNN